MTSKYKKHKHTEEGGVQLIESSASISAFASTLSMSAPDPAIVPIWDVDSFNVIEMLQTLLHNQRIHYELTIKHHHEIWQIKTSLLSGFDVIWPKIQVHLIVVHDIYQIQDDAYQTLYRVTEELITTSLWPLFKVTLEVYVTQTIERLQAIYKSIMSDHMHAIKTKIS